MVGFLGSMTPSSAKGLWKYLRPVLVIGLFISFFIFVPLKGILHALAATHLGLFLFSLLLSFPIFYLAAVTLRILTRKQFLQYSIWELFKINAVTRFYGFFSPFTPVGGGLRWYKLARGGKDAEALSALSVDRALDVLAAVLLGLFWFYSGIHQNTFRPAGLLLVAAIMILGWLAMLRFSPVMAEGMERAASRGGAPWVRRLLQFLGRFLGSLRNYASLSAVDVLILASASILSELLGLGIQILIARSLQMPISPIDLGWMRAVSFLASLAPITLVGGIGLSDVSTVLLLTGVGIPAELAAAYAFLIYIRSAIISLPGGVWELLQLFRK